MFMTLAKGPELGRYKRNARQGLRFLEMTILLECPNRWLHVGNKSQRTIDHADGRHRWLVNLEQGRAQCTMKES